MALQLWMPLMGDLRNQGLSSFNISTLGTISWVTGKLGAKALQAGTASQTSNGVSIDSNLTDILAEEYSVSVWVKPLGNHVHYNGTILSSGNWNGTRWAFGVSQDNTKVDMLSNGYNVYVNCTVPANEWTHLVCTCNSSNQIRLYKNGEYVTYITRSDKPQSDATNTTIGRETYANGYFSFNGVIQDLRLYDHCLSEMEVKQLSQGLVLHYPLNHQGFGSENFILESHKVTSGAQASGITRTYEDDGTVKFVTTAGNGNYATVYFAKSSNANVGGKMSVGDTYTISCDVKVESGTKLPTLFINSGNGYKQLHGTIILGQWIRAYYTSTWAEPGTSYGNITLHLGFSGAVGTYYFKNFKLEKSNVPTPWTPAPTDELYTTLGLNSNIEYDTSGYCNNLDKNGTYSYTSDTPKYAVSTTFNGTERMNGTTPGAEIKTLACWAKTSKNKSTSQFMVADSTSNMCISFYSGCIIGVFGSTRSTGSKCTLGTSYKENDWNHFVVVKTGDAGERAIYCNGEPLTPTTNDYWSVAAGFFIGSRNNSGTLPFYGQICDVRAYATALSADDVKSLYQNCATIDSDGTIRGQIRS